MKIALRNVSLFIASLGICFWAPLSLYAQTLPAVDPELRAYEKQTVAVSGVLQAGAAESVARLMRLWTDAFHRHHKNVTLEVTQIKYTEGGEAAVPDMNPIPEGAKLIALSYPMNEEDRSLVSSRVGVEPIQFAAALDAVVVVVNQVNPLPGLTLTQVKQIFAESQGSEEGPSEWNQLGVNGKLGLRALNRYGRDHTSGTYAAFREMALGKTQQRRDVQEQPGSMSVVIEVGTDQAGIGYAATGFASKSKKVRVLPLARKAGEPYISPTNMSVITGEYPLTRKVYLYAIPEKDGDLSEAVREYITFVLSRDGQQLVKEEGFFPLPSQIAEESLSRLGPKRRLASKSSAATPQH